MSPEPPLAGAVDRVPAATVEWASGRMTAGVLDQKGKRQLPFAVLERSRGRPSLVQADLASSPARLAPSSHDSGQRTGVPRRRSLSCGRPAQRDAELAVDAGWPLRSDRVLRR